MKKLSMLLALVMACAFANAQLYPVDLNSDNDYFTLSVNERPDDDGFPQRILNLYRTNAYPSPGEPVLTHILHSQSGDSNSISYEFGKYEVGDTCIILYSYWCKMGDAPVSPFGARKQVYSVDKEGELIMTDSQIYMERYSDYWEGKEGCVGMKYLFSHPEDEMQSRQYRAYIDGVQEDFDARFVTGEKAQKLLNEVRGIMKEETDRYTAHWDKWEVGFGYKK